MVAGGVTAFVLLTQDKIKNQLQIESSEKVASYHQELDENGIAIDMRDNPVFATKLSGYDYPDYKTITYYSGVTDTIRHANVVLPVDYDENKTYPVLYLLHGLGGSHKTWINKDAEIIIQNLVYFNDVEPMIMVLPNSELNESENLDDYEIWDKVQYYDKTEEDLIKYLKPYIEKNYPVKLGRENTAVAGNSMGGRNTMNVAFKHPEEFGYVGVFSAASVMDNPNGRSFSPLLTDEDLKGKEFNYFMLMVGRQDDVCGWVTYDLHERLEAQGVEHYFYDVEGGHNTYVWQNAMYNFVQRIFK